MVERSLIFNAKGLQLGFIEGNLAFDLGGRQRCSYAEATGNLCDLNTGKVVGHVSLDGTFVGASWVSDDLFGKASGEAQANQAVRETRASHDARKASVPRPVNATTQTAATPQPDTQVAPGHTIYPDYSETGLNPSNRIADDMHAPPSAPHLQPTPEAPGETPRSAAENELFERAIGMIRSALGKGQ
jgi:hypothetical protein